MQSLAKAKKPQEGVVIKESANYYNRMLFVFPSGEIQHYDKRHLFTLAGEDKVYTKGTQKLIIDYLGKICPLYVMICDFQSFLEIQMITICLSM
jgi:predicted amidohydrolase